MGRPQLSDPRNVAVTIKITPSEAERLKAIAGTPGKGVRKAVDRLLGPQKGGTRPITPTAAPEAVTEPAAPPGKHLHRPQGNPVKTTYENGQQVNWYICACGQEMKR